MGICMYMYRRAHAIYEAFNAVDEMRVHKLKPTVDVFNNLLCACISQTDNGFRYALFVWQMALKYRVQPNLTTYNLLLRAMRECSAVEGGIGRHQPRRLPPALPSERKRLFEEERRREAATLGLRGHADDAPDDEYDTLVREDEEARLYDLKRTKNSDEKKPDLQAMCKDMSEVIEIKPEQVNIWLMRE
jgi:hypothetical protein